MKLNSSVYEDLKRALIDALSLDETRDLAKLALEVEWNLVFVEHDTLDVRVEKLIRRAERDNNVHMLVRKALETVPTSQALQTFILDHFHEIIPPLSRFTIRIPGPAPTRRIWLLALAFTIIVAFAAGWGLRSALRLPMREENQWDAKLSAVRYYTPLAFSPTRPANWPKASTGPDLLYTIAGQLSEDASYLSSRAIPGVSTIGIADVVLEIGPFEKAVERVEVSVLVGARSYICAQVYTQRRGRRPELESQPGPIQHGLNPLRLSLPECRAGDRLYVLLSIRALEPATTGGLPPELDDAALPSLISLRRLPNGDAS